MGEHSEPVIKLRVKYHNGCSEKRNHCAGVVVFQSKMTSCACQLREGIQTLGQYGDDRDPLTVLRSQFILGTQEVENTQLDVSVLL